MSSFTEFTAPLDVRYDAEASKVLGADHWRVVREFRYYIDGRDSGQWVTVPAGYLTDGASVPRLLWSAIPPWGPYGQAAVVHDLLCEYLSIMDGGQLLAITRERCDAIFDQAMGVLQVPDGLREKISDGVSLYRRVFGVREPSATPQKRALEAAWRDQ